MEISNQENWDDWVNNNKDPYGGGIIAYAEKWADLMEEKMDEGAELEDIAKQTSHDADTDGITGFMYGAAVQVLATSWVHGERLRKWHNKSYSQEDSNGVVNPAVLVLGKE